MPNKVDYRTFSQRVKNKYPEYINMGDLELAQMWVEQNPQYGEFVMFDQQPVKKKDQAVPSLGEQGGLPSQQPSVQPRKAKEERFFGGTFGNLLDALDMPTPGVPGSGLGIGDFIDDMGRAFSSGKKAGVNISTSRPLFFSGPGSSDEEVQNFVKAGTEYTGPSDEATQFYKDYEDSGKTTFGFVKALAKNPGVAPELVVQSASQFLFNPEARAAFGTAIAAGAGIGAVASAPLGGVGAAPGAIAAILPGVAAANTAVSTLSSFSELMKQELDQRGLEFNEDNVRTILEDEKALRKIRAKSAGYGITIGAFDLATAKVGGAIAAKIPMTTRAGKIKSTLATTGAEAVGGSAGEAAARGVTGQELDPAEIGLEGIAEIPGAAPTLLSQVLKRPTYKINGEFVGQADVDDILQNSSRQELENTKFEVFNDVNMYGFKFRNRLEALGLLEEITEANPNASEADINRLFELNSKLKKVENLNSESAKASADWLRSQIREVQDGLLTQEFAPQEPTITLDVERIDQAAPEAAQVDPAGLSPMEKMEAVMAEITANFDEFNRQNAGPQTTTEQTAQEAPQMAPAEVSPEVGMEMPQEDQGVLQVINSVIQPISSDLEARMNNAEEIPMSEIEAVVDALIDAQQSVRSQEGARTRQTQGGFVTEFGALSDQQKRNFDTLIEQQINKLLNYEFATITTTEQAGEKTKTAGLVATPREGRPLPESVVSRERFDGAGVRIGGRGAGRITVKRIPGFGGRSVYGVSFGNRKGVAPVEDLEFDNLEFVSPEILADGSFNARVKDSKSGLEFTITDPELSIDLAIAAQLKEAGRKEFPQPAFLQAVREVTQGQPTQVTTFPNLGRTGTTPAAVGVEPQTEQDVRQETNAPQEGRGQGEDVTPVPQEEGRQEGQVTPPAVAQEGETPPAAKRARKTKQQIADESKAALEELEKTIGVLQAGKKKPLFQRPGQKAEIDEDTQIELASEEAGISPKNFRDLYRVNRELFGLNQSEAMSAAIAMDKMIDVMAKRAGVSKTEMYGRLNFKKAAEGFAKDLSNRGKLLFQLIGENAELSQEVRNNLQTARVMEAAGESIKSIRLRTGWERGKDGKWKYEIDDSSVSLMFNMKSMSQLGKKYNLDSVLNYPELFSAYPELRKVKISISKKGGSTNEAFFDGKQVVLGIRTYELSSYIEKLQRQELLRNVPADILNVVNAHLETEQLFDDLRSQGFSFDEALDAKMKKSPFNKEVDKMLLESGYGEINNLFGREFIGPNQKFFDVVKAINEAKKEEGRPSAFNLDLNKDLLLTTLHEIQHWIQKKEGFARGGNMVLAYEQLSAGEKSIYDDLQKKSKEKLGELDSQSLKWYEQGDGVRDIVLAPQNFLNRAYRKIAGEVEARNVEKRFGMTPEQRRATTLQETEDVARDEQMVLFEDAMPQGVKFQVDAWHGSPYQFDKFKTENIGTGEGAQAFGWGLYFTDLKSIAETYARNLSKKNYSKFLFNGKPVSDSIGNILDYFDYTGFDVNLKNIKQSLINYITEEIQEDPAQEQRYRSEIDFIRKANVAENKSKGVAYKVSINKGKNPDQYTWLEWDKPVGEENAKRILTQLKKEGLLEKAETNWSRKNMSGSFSGKESLENDLKNLRGNHLYERFLSPRVTPVADGLGTAAINRLFGSAKEASLFLLRSGIDGSKYPAESIARGATSDTARGFNYVVFDENAVSIEDVIKFQEDAVKARGAMMITLDGQATIYALTDPNVSTPLHELAHVFEHYLTDEEKATVQEWAKTEDWTIKTSEAFARGFEKYLAEGKAPTPALQKIFDNFKQWLTDIYRGIVGSDIDIELNEPMRDLYAKMFEFTGEDGPSNFEKWKGDNKLLVGPDIQDAKTGEPIVVRAYHGTTNEFYEFDSSVKGSVEGHLGKVNYFTSDYQDASINYLSEGPDLTNRVEGRTDQIMSELENNYDDYNESIPELSKKYGYTEEELQDDFVSFRSLARDLAKKELYGGTSKVLDVFIKLNNPVVLGKGSTWFQTLNISEADFDQAAQEIADENDISIEEAKQDYDFDIRDRAIENSGYENLAVDALSSALRSNGYRGASASEILGDNLYESEIDLNRLEKELRQNDKAGLFENEEGELASSQVVSDFLKNLGFDGIILTDVSSRFRGMGLGSLTSHIHVFDEFANQIKLADGSNTTFGETRDIRFQLDDGKPQPGTKVETGEDVARMASEMQSDQGFSDFTLRRIASEDYTRETASIDELRKNDPSLEEYIAAGEMRETVGTTAAVPPIVSSNGEVIDGYNRILQAVENGEKSIEVLKGRPKAQPEAQVEATAKALEEAVKDNPAKFIQEENGFRITGGIFDIKFAAIEADKIQDVKTPSSLSFLPKTLTVSHLARSKKDKNNILKNGFDINQASIESSIKGAYFSSEDWSTMDRFGRVKEDSLYVDIDNDGLLYFDSLDSFVDYLKSNNFPYEGQTLTDSQMQKLKDNGVKGILLREDFASQARNELIVIDDSIIKNISESPKDITKLPSSFSNIKEIAEAYHKAKADGSGPKLVQAVEDLLGQTAPEAKPAKTIAEQRKEFRETAKKYFDGLKKMGIAFDPEGNSKEDIAFLKALAKYIKLELDNGMVTFKGFLEKTSNLIEGFNEKAVVSAAKEAWAKEVVKAYPKLYAKYSAAKRKELEREIKDIKKTMIRKIIERTDPKIVNFKSQLKTEKRRLSKEAAAQLAAINNAYDVKTMMAMEPQDLMELLNLTEGIYKEGRSEIKALNESLDEAAQIQGEEMLAAITSKDKRLDKLSDKEAARRKLKFKSGVVVAVNNDERVILKEEAELDALTGEGYNFFFLNTTGDKVVNRGFLDSVASFFSGKLRTINENARDLRTALELIKSKSKESQDFINGLVAKMNKASVTKARKSEDWSSILKDERTKFFGPDIKFGYTNWMNAIAKVDGKALELIDGRGEPIGPINNGKIVSLYRQLMDPTNLVKTDNVRKINLSDESIQSIIDYMNLPANKPGKDFALSLTKFFLQVAKDTKAVLENNGYNSTKLDEKRYNAEDFEGDEFIAQVMGQFADTRTEGFIPYTPIQATESPDTIQGVEINEDDLLNSGDLQKNFSVISNNMITRRPGGVIVPTDIRQTLNAYTAGMANMNAKLPLLRETQSVFSKRNLTAMSNAFAPQFTENLKANYISFMTDRVTPVISNKTEAAIKTWLMTSTAIPMFLSSKTGLLQLLGGPNFIVSYDLSKYIDASKKLLSDGALFKETILEIINLPIMKQRYGGRFSPDSRVISEEMSKYGKVAINIPFTNLKISAKELLSKGYIFSSIGDVFAIAFGGAPIYYDIVQTNKKKYTSEGMSALEAEKKAKQDAEEKLFEIIQETQQSSEAMYLSQFQKQSITRIFSSFATSTMQYYRKARRAAARMKNKEGNQLQNAYEILHYTAINAAVFQFFSSMFVDWLSGPGEDELEEMSREERMDFVRYMEDVMATVAQGTGGLGVALQALILAYKESEKSGKPEKIVESALRTMPAVRMKYDAAINTLREWKRGDYVRSLTRGAELANIPADRIRSLGLQVSDALMENLDAQERIARLMGFRTESWMREKKQGEIWNGVQSAVDKSTPAERQRAISNTKSAYRDLFQLYGKRYAEATTEAEKARVDSIASKELLNVYNHRQGGQELTEELQKLFNQSAEFNSLPKDMQKLKNMETNRKIGDVVEEVLSLEKKSEKKAMEYWSSLVNNGILSDKEIERIREEYNTRKGLQ